MDPAAKKPKLENESVSSSYHGMFYHLRLGMVILLHSYNFHRKGTLPHLSITMEDCEAGKFDDIVIRYASSTTPKGTIYIQAKHKLSSENTKPLTEGDFFTKKASNTPFSVPILIAMSVERVTSNVFTFKREFWTAHDATPMGRLRIIVEREYGKLPQNKPKEEALQLTISNASINFPNAAANPGSVDQFCFEQIDRIIHQFCDEFLLVCGSKSESNLLTDAHELMPNWVRDRKGAFENLQTLLLEALRGEGSNTIMLNQIKEKYIEYFARLASLEGIRRLYLSSRPYDFVDEMKHTFIACKLFQLEEFTVRDRICFLYNFFMAEMVEFSECNEQRKLKILDIDKTGAMDAVSFNAAQIQITDEVNYTLLQRHFLLAVWVTFDKAIRAQLLSGHELQEASQYIEYFAEAKEKAGIIMGVQDDVPMFKHRMFAEYFAACFRYLLDHSADLYSNDEQGRNLLHITAQYGCIYMVQCLLLKGFDLSERNAVNGSQLLIISITYNR
uniref:ANK_REP_REGION domain-containing protein n=1 Tax=Anopheles merus TaxID=30066 RepID=A0A182UPC1_ANOME